MADTLQTIQTNLLALNFTNESATALYNKIATALSITVDLTKTEIANSQNNILSIINDQRYGKSGYYTTQAKGFQFGDDLIIDPITLDDVYAVIDVTKQIISQAAFEEITSGVSSQLFLKVATLDPVTALLTALSNDQYAAFASYFTNFEIPGLPVAIISNPPNLLAFTAVATFFSTYNQTTLQTNLQNAMNAFRNSFAFNGEFFDGDLEDYIKQNVPGIRNFYITNTSIDGTAFQGFITLPAGYFNYVPSIFSSITYSPVNG